MLKTTLRTSEKISAHLHALEIACPSILSATENAFTPNIENTKEHIKAIMDTQSCILRWKIATMGFQQILYEMCETISILAASDSALKIQCKAEFIRKLINQAVAANETYKDIWFTPKKVQEIQDALKPEEFDKISKALMSLKSSTELLQKQIGWLVEKACYLNNDTLTTFYGLDQLLQHLKIEKTVNYNGYVKIAVKATTTIVENPIPPETPLPNPPATRSSKRKHSDTPSTYSVKRQMTLSQLMPNIVFLELNLKMPDTAIEKLQSDMELPTKLLAARNNIVSAVFVHSFEIIMPEQEKIRYRVVSLKDNTDHIKNYVERAKRVYANLSKKLMTAKRALSGKKLSANALCKLDPSGEEYKFMAFADELSSGSEEEVDEETQTASEEPTPPYYMSDEGTAYILQSDGSYKALEPGEVMDLDYMPNGVQETENEVFELMLVDDESVNDIN